MVRDDLSFDEACQILWGEGLEMSAAELAEIRAKLPPRHIRRFLPEEKLQTMASPELRPDERLEQREAGRSTRRIYSILRRTLDMFHKEDQLLVEMRMKLKVADIARILQMDQKSLYRRLDKLYERLRKELEKQGVRRQDIEDLLRRLQPGFLDFSGVTNGRKRSNLS